MGRALVVALVFAALCMVAHVQFSTAAEEADAQVVAEDGWAYYDSAEEAAASFLEADAADVEADAAEDEAEADAESEEEEAAADEEADAEAEEADDEEHAVLMELDADTEAQLVAEAAAEAELEAEGETEVELEVTNTVLAEAAYMRARMTAAVDKAVRVVADADTLRAADREWAAAKGNRPVSSFAVEQQARVVPLMALQHRAVNYLLAEFASTVVAQQQQQHADSEEVDAQTLLLEAAADSDAEAGVAALNEDMSAGAFMNGRDVALLERGMAPEAKALYQAMKVELAYRMAAHVVSGWSEDSQLSFPRFRATVSSSLESVAANALDALDSVSGIWDTIKSAGSAAYNFGKDMVNDTVDTMKQGYEAVKDLPSSAMDCVGGKGCGRLAENGLKIADAATSLPVSPTGLLKAAGKTALKKVAKKVIKDKVKDMAKNKAKDMAKKTMKDKIKDKVKDKVKEKVKDEIKDKAKEKMQDMADKEKEKKEQEQEKKDDKEKPEKPEGEKPEDKKDEPKDKPEMPEKPEGGDREGGGDRGGDREGGDRGDREGGGRGDRRRGGGGRGGDRGDRGDRDGDRDRGGR